jgi:hypothetical protein
MRFKLKKALDNSEFTGRNPEQDKLLSFLRNPLGGTLLIAGERGSGKSTLVNHTVSKIKTEVVPRFLAGKFTREKLVKVELPYLPKHLVELGEAEDSKKAELTSLILRALSQTLVAENGERINPKVPIPKSWFRPIGYNRGLKELDKLTRFTEITQNNSSSLKMKLSKLVDMGGSKQLSYVYDLSDTILEVKLRRLFNTYAKQLKLVFIFDELDKLDGQKLDVLDFVHFLKNLFTHSGAHFIFIATDSIYLKLEKEISSKPYGIEHTLFTEKFLLNNLNPRDFQTWFKKFFDVKSDEYSSDFYEMMYSLAWHTKQHPYDALNLLRRSQVTEKDGNFVDTEMLDGFFDSLTWTYHSTMQTFVDYVYGKHCDLNDNHFNKILYRSIRTASQYVINGDQKLVNRKSFLTSLFVTSDFVDETTELSGKSNVGFNGLLDSNIGTGDWRGELIALSTNQKERLERALMNLFFLLDREGSLKLRLTDDMPDDSDMLRVEFVGDGFGLSNLKVPFNLSSGFDTYYEPTQVMVSDFEVSQAVNNRFKAVFEKDVWDFYSSSTIDTTNRRGDSIAVRLSENHRYLFTLDIDRYHNQLATIETTIHTKLVEGINAGLSEIFKDDPRQSRRRAFQLAERNGFFEYVDTTVNRTYRLHFNASDPSKATIEAENEYNVNIVDLDSLRKSKKYRRSAWRDFTAAEDWSNIVDVSSKVVVHIKSLAQN